MSKDDAQAQKDFDRYCELEGVASVPGTFIPVDPDEAEAFGAFEETAISERDALEASYDNADDYDVEASPSAPEKSKAPHAAEPSH